MLSVTQGFVEGAGTIPTAIDVGSIVSLDASANSATFFEWSLMSAPQESVARLYSPVSSVTQIGPLDKVGVYLFQLYIDRGLSTQKNRILSLSVPAAGAVAAPPIPEFGSGGSIRNFSFELPGDFPGYAAYWDVVDDANILAAQAGILRGRIVPTNFAPTKGDYAFCLGDDISGEANFYVDNEFSISQEVDFTGVTTLKLDLKFRE